MTDYWITVGGAVESFEQALVREIFEETGHLLPEVGPCLWLRRKTVIDGSGAALTSDEQYYRCELSAADPSDRHWLDAERSLFQEFRWWPLDDPGLSEVRILPEGFVAAAREVLRHGPPASPLRLGTTADARPADPTDRR